MGGNSENKFEFSRIRKRGRPMLRSADSVESNFGIKNEKILENKSEQEVIMKESSKGGSDPGGAVMPEMMMK
ncbi:hypothetical protein TNCV_232371 [Trichonephila clavipes]|nr:hypothetical protein TNCV_232371 [Trichonephila clavipes]